MKKLILFLLISIPVVVQPQQIDDRKALQNAMDAAAYTSHKSKIWIPSDLISIAIAGFAQAGNNDYGYARIGKDTTKPIKKPVKKATPKLLATGDTLLLLSKYNFLIINGKVYYVDRRVKGFVRLVEPKTVAWRPIRERYLKEFELDNEYPDQKSFGFHSHSGINMATQIMPTGYLDEKTDQEAFRKFLREESYRRNK